MGRKINGRIMEKGGDGKGISKRNARQRE